MADGQRRATLKDVSSLAKVSIITASRALKSEGSHYVSQATRKKVLKAAEALGYIPDGLARAMRIGRTHNVGLVVPRRSDGHMEILGYFLGGLEAALLQHGYNILISAIVGEDIEKGLLPGVAASRYVDGLIFLGIQNRKYVAAVHEKFGKMVGLDMRLPSDCACVYPDNRGIGRIVAKHLLDYGHRRFGLITDLVSVNLGERVDGFVESVKGAGGRIIHLAKVDAWAHGGCEGMKEILRMKPKPTAIFCANDSLARDAMKAIREHGLSVPGDISVIGCDNTRECQDMTPPLTSVAYDKPYMGKAAADLIEQLIVGKRVEQRQVVIPAQLVPRQSDGPPRDAAARRAGRPAAR